MSASREPATNHGLETACTELLVSPEVRALAAQHGMDVHIELRPLAGGAPTEAEVALLHEALGAAGQQLAEQRRLGNMGRLGAGIVHEVRNVMTGILGFAQVSRRRLEESSENAAPVVLMIEEESLRCLEILGRYHRFARPDAGHDEAIEIDALILGTAAILEHQLQLAGVRLTTSIAPGTPRVVGQSGALKQVLVNLALNAAAAMAPSGGVAELRARGVGRTVQIELADEGCGIAHDVLPRIFDPFFTTHAEHGGTGMGLYVCREIVASLGGTIRAQSEIGKGTTFLIELPSADAEAAQP